MVSGETSEVDQAQLLEWHQGAGCVPGIQEDEHKETRGTGKMGFVSSIALKSLHGPTPNAGFMGHRKRCMRAFTQHHCARLSGPQMRSKREEADIPQAKQKPISMEKLL